VLVKVCDIPAHIEIAWIAVILPRKHITRMAHIGIWNVTNRETPLFSLPWQWYISLSDFHMIFLYYSNDNNKTVFFKGEEETNKGGET